MNLKSFLIASLIIHIIGAITLYFYYNPIHLGPSPQPEKISKPVQVSPDDKSPSAKKVSPPQKKKIPPPPKVFKEDLPSIKPDLESHIDQGEQDEQTNTEETSSEEGIELIDIRPQDPALDDSADSPSQDSNLEEPSTQKEDSEDLGEDIPKPTELLDSFPEQKDEVIKDSKELDISKEDFEEVEETTSPKAFSSPSDKREEQEDPVQEPKLETEEPAILNTTDETQELESPKLENTGESSTIPKEDFEELEELPVESPPSPTKNLENSSSQISPQAPTKNRPRSFFSLRQRSGNPPLTYPDDSARKQGLEGTVSILFFVNKQGLADQIQVTSSSGHRVLDNFVISTLARYQFEPNQESWVEHNVRFSLEGEEMESPSRSDE